MKIKAVVFDLDGVIVSTDTLHYRAWKRLADELGIYFDKTINDRLRGVSRMESLAIVLEQSQIRYSDEQRKTFSERKNCYYLSLLEELTPVDILPQVVETLNLLRKRCILIAIASSSKNAKNILKK
jgi:beta-phosphoglucomutase